MYYHHLHPHFYLSPSISKHEKSHSPRMNHGVVIKSNGNQRYATNGITGFYVRELARRAGVPIQEFAVRNDCPCGSTIGPIISQNTGTNECLNNELIESDECYHLFLSLY